MKLFAFFAFVLLSAILPACNPGNHAPSGFDEVLQQPPFKSLTDSIAQRPGDAGLLLRRAELLSQNNQHDIAYYDYKKSWELQPSAPAALAYVSNLLLTGRNKDAVALLKQCMTQFPGNPDIIRRLAEAYSSSGDNNAALGIYDDLLKVDTANFEAVYEKGMIYAHMKDTAKAINMLEHAWKMQPTVQNGLALANLYAETKNERALALCDALQQKDTARDFVDPVFLKGVYFSNIKDYPKAISYFDESINRDWRFIDPYIEKGIILFEEKNYDEALKTFQFATNISYTNADNYYWMGRCYEAIGKKEEALGYYYKALMFDKDFTEAKEAIRRLK